jgi:drug/metabolite transporter (DMT)-like permease
MTPSQIVGIIALVVGVILLGFGFNASDAPVDKVSETLTGRYTDRTMWYFILGAVGVIAGGLLAVFGRRAT